MNFYLYVDNFRGFSDTCIPVRDVNFLVGENSTGKSSILALIKLISGHRFLMNQNFNDEDVGFSHFSDMVSANSPDQSYFRFGVVTEIKQPRSTENERRPIGFLFTFKEEQGQAQLFKCTFGQNEEVVTLKFGKAISYKLSKCSACSSAQETITLLKSAWVGEHSGADVGYEKLGVSGFSGKVPIPYVLSVVSDISRKTKKKYGGIDLWHQDFFPPSVTWFGPIRTKPRRTYDEWSTEFTPEGRHTPYLIRKML